MLNIGHRPTVGGDDKTVEVHIFDFSDDIYDSEISLEFIDMIRKEEKFESVEQLKAQLQQDEIAVKARLAQFSED